MVPAIRNSLVVLALVLVTALSYGRMGSQSHGTGEPMMLAAALVLGIMAALCVRIVFAAMECAANLVRRPVRRKQSPEA